MITESVLGQSCLYFQDSYPMKAFFFTGTLVTEIALVHFIIFAMGSCFFSMVFSEHCLASLGLWVILGSQIIFFDYLEL